MANGDGIFARCNQSVVLQLAFYTATALIFAGGLWVTFQGDRASFRKQDELHAAQIHDTRVLTEANAAAIRDLLSALQSEKDIQSMRNGMHYATASDHEGRLRKLELR